MSSHPLVINGARRANLKNISVTIKPHCWTALWGPSGAGKHALAVGTVATIARERLEKLVALQLPNESLKLKREDAELGPLPPVVVVADPAPLRPQATVAAFLGWDTALYRIMGQGSRSCPTCKAEWQPPRGDLFTTIETGYVDKALLIAAVAPVPAIAFRESADRYGLDTVVSAGRIRPLAAAATNESYLLIDRLTVGPGNGERLRRDIQVSRELGARGLVLFEMDEGLEQIQSPPAFFSAKPLCRLCGCSLSAFQPRHFDFNLAGAERNYQQQLTQLKGLEALTPAQLVEFQSLKTERLILGPLLKQPIRNWAAQKEKFDDPGISRILAELSTLELGHLRPLQALGELSPTEGRRLSAAAALARQGSAALYVLEDLGSFTANQYVSRRLQSNANTVIALLHDFKSAAQADEIIQMGSGAAARGGRIIAQGAPENFSPPAAELIPETRPPAADFIIFKSTKSTATQSWRFPVGRLSCLSGPLGSGKRSFLFNELAPALAAALDRHGDTTNSNSISLVPGIKKLLVLRRRPALPRRPLLAHFKGLWEPIAAFYAELEQARVRGYGPSVFSLAPKRPAATVDLAAKFTTELAADFLTPESAEVSFRGHSPAALLALSVDQVLELLPPLRGTAAILQQLKALGLPELRLGQDLATLSSGELSRLLLAHRLAAASAGTVLLLEEPAFDCDSRQSALVAAALGDFTAQGHTVIALDYQPEILAAADYVLSF